MKKVAAVLLAGVLMVGAAVSAFAAPSSEALSTPAGYGATVDSASNVPAGDRIIINNTYDTADEQAAASAIQAAGGVQDASEESGISSDLAGRLTLLDLFNLRLEIADDYDGSATITFTIAGVTTSSVVYVLHYHNGAWEQVPITLGRNTVTATFATGFSPVAILVDKDTLSTSSSSTTSSSSSATTSPKTGEAPVIPVLFLVAAAAVAGMAVSGRKRHA